MFRLESNSNRLYFGIDPDLEPKGGHDQGHMTVFLNFGIPLYFRTDCHGKFLYILLSMVLSNG